MFKNHSLDLGNLMFSHIDSDFKFFYNSQLFM